MNFDKENNISRFILKVIVLPAIILLILDGLYIYANRTFLIGQLEAVQHSPIKVNILGAVACYILILLGLYFFIFRYKSRSIQEQTWNAFVLGIVIYGVYETTNYATLKSWTLKMVLMDTLWGGILLASTTYLTSILL